MFERAYKDTEEQISVLGMGCMRLPKLYEDKEDIDYAKAQQIIDYAYDHGVNYFDTAYPYHGGGSEPFVGQALKKYPRDSFYLATKLPVWLVQSEEDVERIFNEQLERCQVDYFDFYLCHALDADRWENKIQKFSIYQLLSKKKAEGKIKHLGFSFHDTPEVLRKIVSGYQWDFAQIQLNYLDWEMQRAKEQYEILEEFGVPCVVMEPVRGGMLAQLSQESAAELKKANPDGSVASWAIRYAASLPNVITVLSGMSNMEQVEDNVKTMTNFQPLSAEDHQTIGRALEIYRRNVTVPCTGCRYCMDCPAGVDIPAVFQIHNQYAVNKNKNAFQTDYAALGEAKQAVNCVSCGKCMEHCPQGIQIPDEMKKITELAK